VTTCNLGSRDDFSAALGLQATPSDNLSLGVFRRTRLGVGVLLASFVLTPQAYACVCPNEPLRERLDDADAAIVGTVVGSRETSLRGQPQTLLTVEVVQRVKGDVPSELVVTSPRGTDCDLELSDSASGRTSGLLLERAPDGATWLGSACSIVEAGALVAEGGEPRGGPIKVLVGVVILALVLLWSFRRLKHRTRPELPRRL
jgi:hypothetical protein